MRESKATGKKKFGFFNVLMLIANLSFLVAIGLSYLAVYTSPEKNWILPFFGLAYPFLLLVNLFFMIYWMIRRRWIFLVPAIVIFSGWSHIERTYRVNFFGSDKLSDSSFKIVSFNVKNLSNNNVKIIDPEVRTRIIEFLDAQNADIICMQEFAIVHRNPDAFIDSLSHLLSMPYHCYSLYQSRSKKYMDAIFIFSRFAIIDYHEISGQNSKNYGIRADLEIGGDTARLFNVHMESVRFRHEDYSFISEFDLQFEKSEKLQEGYLRIFSKLRYAFIKRAGQVENLADLVKWSPHPVILCGDFNDTPNSYTYQMLTSDLTDAFVESGNGFGNTYIGNLPSFRIDYILYDDHFMSANYRRNQLKLSDHYPLSCQIELLHEK